MQDNKQVLFDILWHNRAGLTDKCLFYMPLSLTADHVDYYKHDRIETKDGLVDMFGQSHDPILLVQFTEDL